MALNELLGTMELYQRSQYWDKEAIVSTIERNIKAYGINNVAYDDIYVLFIHYVNSTPSAGFCNNYYTAKVYQRKVDRLEDKFDKLGNGVGDRLAKRKMLAEPTRLAEAFMSYALKEEVEKLARSASVSYRHMKDALLSRDMLYTDVCDYIASK